VSAALRALVRWLGRGGGPLLLWLAGVGGLWGAAAPAQAGPAEAPDCGQAGAVPWQRLAPGVWVWPSALPSDISALNAGHVAPTSVVIDGGEALVIDPGPSHQHGLRVRASLACRFQARVRWIVNTHAHAENVLANSAFADLLAAGRLEILASAPTREAMRRRCPDCLASLSAKLGADAMAGMQIVLPSRTLTEGEVLRVGRHRLRVMRVEQGHTEGDLVLWSARERLLWAGGLVYGERVPELAQGSVDGWLAALERLAALRPRLLVSSTVSRALAPGALPPALTDTRHYLTDLRAGVLQAMDRGLQASESGTVALPAYRAWAGHTERHDFNVQRAWRELEPLWMERSDPSAPETH
jgi:glyoxylase-like metal-dependent hydrolase (beta-lactamase superfamily II)